MKNAHHVGLAVLAAAALTSLPAAAQFGGLLAAAAKPTATANDGTGAGNLDQALKSFSDKSSSIESTLYNASLAMGWALAKEEDRAKLKAMQESVGSSTDPKEKNARREETMQTAQAIARQAAESNELDATAKGLSDGKKKLLSQGVSLYLLGALQAKDLMPTGQNLLSSAASNPMNLGKIAGVKDSMPRLGRAVSYAAQSVPKLVQALRGAKVAVVEPKSSTETMPSPADSDFSANS